MGAFGRNCLLLTPIRYLVNRFKVGPYYIVVDSYCVLSLEVFFVEILGDVHLFYRYNISPFFTENLSFQSYILHVDLRWIFACQKGFQGPPLRRLGRLGGSTGTRNPLIQALNGYVNKILPFVDNNAKITLPINR